MIKHTCHADRCDTQVPRRMFMCHHHWSMLPRAMRDEVWDTYTPGQENNTSLVTHQYLDVTRLCIDYVAVAETLNVRDDLREQA